MSNQILKNMMSIRKGIVMLVFLFVSNVNITKAQCFIFPQDTSICYGSSIALTVDTFLTTSILWSTGDSTNSIVVAPTQTTTVWVEQVFNGRTCYDSVTITVLPEINITANITNPSSPILANGNITTLVTGGGGGYIYQWDTAGTVLNQFTGPNALNLIENTYCLNILDVNGCTADTCFAVEWNPCQVLDSLITPAACNGDQAMIEITVDTTSGLGPFTWNPIFQTQFEFSFYSVNPYALVSTIPLNTPVANQFLSAGEYIVSVYDRSWQDSCYTDTIVITEPDPITITTTTFSVTLPGNNNGVINIDNITGGTSPYISIDWYDQSGNLFASDTTLVDSLSYANDYTGGYQISVTDTNGCTEDTIIYLDPLNPEQTLDTALSIFNQTTCFGYCDGSIFIEMEDVGNSSVPPFTYVLMDFSNFGVYDTITLGHPYYSANTHSLNYINLCAGAYQIQTFDYYGNTGPVVEGIVAEPAQVQVDLGPDFVLRCGEDTVIAGDAAGGNILNDTILVSQNTLSWGSNSTAFTDTLDPAKEYLLVVQGTYQDNQGNTFDAAYNVGTQAPANDWILGTGTAHRPSPDVFNVNNTYNFEFSGFSGVQQVVLPGGTNFSGNLSFVLYEISLDTTIYNWVWTTIPASNPAIISDLDTAYVYPGVNGTDYVLTLTDQLGCFGSDTVNASWNLNILIIDSITSTNVGCNGGQTGSIAVVMDTTSGFQPFTYYIDGNITNDTTFNLSAGTYSVSVSDDIGCLSDTVLVDIIENDSLYACIDNVNFVSVQVDQFVMSFDTAFSYTSVATQLGLDYELVVSGTFHDTLWVPYQDAAYNWNSANPNIGFVHTNNPWSWNGLTNNRPNPDVYDPITHTYTYSFVGDGSAQIFDYIDSNGDYFGSGGQLTFTLYKLVCPNTDTAYTCFGQGTGSATMYANGGVPFLDANGNAYYKYEWQDNAGNVVDTNMTATNLSAGLYTASVIDALGCTYFRDLLVIEPENPLSIDTSSNFANVLCYGDSTGSITLYNSGGFSPYFCVLLRDIGGILDTVQTVMGDIDTLVFDDLPVGSYQYILYDMMPDSVYGTYMPCPETMSFQLTQPLELITTASLIDHIDCWGDSTGQASVSVIGGASPYTYNWTSVGDTTPISNNLYADTSLPFPSTTWHYVTVTDSNGCQRTDSVQIEHMYQKIRPFYINTAGQGIYEINILEDSVTCYGDCDGSAALSTVGGVLPHTYVWDVPSVNSPNYTSMNQPDTVDWLCAGGHDIIVTDDVGCETIIRYQIEQPNQIYAIGNLTTPISCFGYDDGSAFVYGIGGNDIPPATYTYSWQLDPNLYSTFDDSLFWASDTNASGQSFNNISAQLTDSILPPGIHVVTVTDYKGCFASDTVEFIEPSQLTVDIIDSMIVYAYCDNTESASLCAQAFGGTPNYTYQFNDDYHQNNVGSSSGENNPFCATNLTPYNSQTTAGVPLGYYYVSVIDERGCFADDYIDIDSVTNSFNTSSIQYTSQDVSCYNGSNGEINISNISGGVGTFPAGYTITWTGPNGYSNNIPVISSLEAGNYALIVRDSSAPIPCQVTINIPITEPDQLLVTIYDKNDATCFPEDPLGFINPPAAGSCDGQVMVDITGGTGPYFYDLDELGVYPLTNTSAIPTPGDTLISSLCTGPHTIYVTDINGCEGSVLPGGVGTVHIDSGRIVRAQSSVTQLPSCSNTNDGAAIVLFPSNDISYSWQTNNLTPPSGPSGNILGTGTSFNNFYGGDYWLVASYTPASNFGLPVPGCDAIDLVSILTPTTITYTYNYVSPLCWGDANGQIQITAISGGSGPYSVEWDNTTSLPNGFSTTFPIPGFNPPANLLAGTYAFTISDANECTLTDSIELLQPEQLQVNFASQSTSCNGGIDGIIEVINISGGVFNPTPVKADFSWSPNLAPIGAPNNLEWEGGAGTYNVVVTDVQGCSLIDTVIIDEPDPIEVSLDPLIYGVDASGNNIHVSCFGSSDGELVTIVSGGNNGYTYSIGSTNNTSGIFTGLSSGSVTVDVEDVKACLGQATIVLNSPTAVNLDLTPYVNDFGNNISCFGGSDGSIVTTVSGGIPEDNGTYNYSWSNGATSQDVVGLTAGTYTCVVTDANGCSDNMSVTLIEPNETFDANVITTNYGGPGNQVYTIEFQDLTTDNSGNPITDLTHEWCWDYSVFFNENIQAYDTICNQSPLSFTNTEFFSYDFDIIGSNSIYVVVTDNSTGCKDKVDFTIDVQGMPEANNIFSPNGDGVNDVFSFGEYAMDKMNVEIYNRWGERVYSWDGENKSWDGNGVDGQPLSEGVYFYVLQATGQDGYHYEKKGSITLVR